jgi:hypothetical protein
VLPSRSEKKAIRVPSGETRGQMSVLVLFVSRSAAAAY